MAKNTHTERATIQLIIDGKQAETSIKEVRQSMIMLERQLTNMKKADDPAGYAAATRELQKLKAAHGQMVAELRGGESSWSKFKANSKEIALGTLGGNLAEAGLSALKQGITKLIDISGELSDELADVQKQTGLAGKDLQELNAELQAINTRTPVEELRSLAAVAGKLGYDTKDDVLAFVRAADQINVALGEDLGGNIEDVTNDIGKLVEIFGLEEEFGIEKAMLKTASAINVAGASSAANEGYLVAWTKRFAGIAPNAGISIADTLGLAATMDILGQSSELSATNVGKMIIAIGKDLPHFAQVAGMSVMDFSALLKKDANEAFVKVLEGAKSAEGGVEGMIKTLEALGIEGSEGAQVLGALTNNTKLLREQQGLLNDAYDVGTSVSGEFNIKNENTAAILEKLGKRITILWEQASAAVNPLIRLFGKWAGVVDELEEGLAAIQTQQDVVAGAEKNLVPIIERYDRLATNTKRSKEEQAEFMKLTRQIADAVPGAVTAWDNYGNALQLNTWKARDFVEQQQKMLKAMRDTQKEAAKGELAELNREAIRIKTELERGKVSMNTGMGQYRDVALTDRDFAQRTKRLTSIREREARIKDGLAALDKPSPAVKPDTGASNAAGTGITKNSPGGSYTGTGQSGNAVSDVRKLDDELLKNQQQLTLNLMSEHEKQIVAAHNKYEQMRKLAGNNKEDLAKIAAQEAQEMEQINEQTNRKNLESFDKMMRTKLSAMNDQADQKRAFEQKLAEEDAQRQDKELSDIREHYRDLIAEAELLGRDTTDIYIRMYNAIRDLQLARNNEELEKDVEKNKKLLEEKKKLANDQNKKDEDDQEDWMADIEMRKRAYSDMAQAVSDVFSIMASNETDFAEFQKAIGLVQLAIDSGAAIAGAVRAASVSSPNPFVLVASIATAIATVTANILKAKQLIQKANVPEPPAFRAAGGYTDMGSLAADPGGPEGWVSRPTLFSMGSRRYVAGERGREYVISNPMLRNPAVANFVGIMEVLRQQNQFANPASIPAPQSVNKGPVMDPQLAEIARLLRELNNKPSAWNHAPLEEYQNLVSSIRRRASA
ncbi:phage tail tape measure protein [Salmonirosea aquatica]|uniref:Phage tail tape measure protein n=1 Tax=Salmonirosea aquatica TaxID=2654236 RepID=A0A7C9BG70_9BACT|nr:phage tail tape measure protein [Cytophagaceae bacterium SJW1-29]